MSNVCTALSLKRSSVVCAWRDVAAADCRMRPMTRRRSKDLNIRFPLQRELEAHDRRPTRLGVDVADVERVDERFAKEVALDADPAMHLPVAAERPGVLGQRRDVIGPWVRERLVAVVLAAQRESIETGSDVQSLTTPALLAKDADHTGEIRTALHEIGQISARDRLTEAFIGEL